MESVSQSEQSSPRKPRKIILPIGAGVVASALPEGLSGLVDLGLIFVSFILVTTWYILQLRHF